jgi:hypothetical protein
MKTSCRLIFILLFFIMVMKVGANTTKSIIDQDTTIIIIYRTMVNNNSLHSISNSIKEDKFAVMPDTTINVIIISRRVYTDNFGFETQTNQKTCMSDGLYLRKAATVQLPDQRKNQVIIKDTDYKNKLV